MTPEQRQVFESLPDDKLIALTVYGEARGESPTGKQAVAEVIVNRSHKWAKTISEICLAKNQFSCFLTTDPNFILLQELAKKFDSSLMNTRTLLSCLHASEDALSLTADLTGGATFYRRTENHNPWFDNQIRIGKLVETVVLGNHTFYKEV